ncbi:Ulp1 protease family C-terminal catalytic domain [Arabidopsis thaliana x Arabidopsis arenosa]|uniref:Ulp1 protease family C-terminal catalytic domain n=1 Tax=Arabidopsis thaliana x Arabidopsis arenosa TaxID=1240361 RepID=A0A8T2C5U2_9BRAS|nr:Ulp1 protease family C-terminal catalytic domain [Arabidopsis thaliana x Arabidopsis arenosa]
MPPILLPPRLIAFGHEPRGDRVNVYHKMKTLCAIFNALDDGERQFLSRSTFGQLLEFPNKPAWSASFGIFILGRQLEVAKPNEIWVLFAGIPIRFSLREFKIVTGLPCGKYPNLKKKKKKGTAGKTIPFYSKLFGLEEDVTVDRAITMLKKRIISDADMRIRLACLAIVDGFLVPTSHYPKIVKAHAEMVEDVDAFLAFPWGRLSFEMMIKSIKEREIEQLAITCFSVQGLLYALQLVVLQAAPSIQDGPVIDEIIESEAEAGDVDVEDAPRESVPFKLGNAKVLDKKCSIFVDTIICPDYVLNPEEDLSWSDDEEDEKVDNILMFVGEGLIFKNDMFDGGVIPSQLKLASKKQKRGGKSNGCRTRKAAKLTKNGGVRSRQERPIPEEGGSSGGPSLESISLLLDAKLEGQAKKIIAAVTDWFTKNTVIEGETSKEPVSGSTRHKKAANNGNEGVANSDGLGSNGGDDDIGFDSLRHSRGHARSHCREGTSNVEATVDEILSFYSEKVPTGVGCKEAGRENAVPMGEDILHAGDVVHNSQGVNNVTADVVPPTECVDEDNPEDGNNVTGDVAPPTESVGEDNAEPENNVPMDEDRPFPGLIAHPQGADNVAGGAELTLQAGGGDNSKASCYRVENVPVNEAFITPNESIVNEEVQCSQPTGGVAAPPRNALEESQGVPASDDGTVGEETPVGIPDISASLPSDGGVVCDGEGVDTPEAVSIDMAATKDLGAGRAAPSVVSSQREDSDEDFTTPPPSKVGKAPFQGDCNANDLDGMLGRRSKRVRTLSTKLDGRFQYDKKTKLLVGHPSPVVNQANICVDPEERFQNSLKKLKAISSISFCGGVALSNKDILDLIDRKKNLSSKVMDALIKFSRHLLRTDDVDGDKLRVEVLDSKFVSLFCRQFPKFSRCPSKSEFQFPLPLTDLLSGAGESDRVQLFTEADYLYLPFNFDKKHWVVLAVDLKSRKIIVLDSNIQRRKDSAILDELMPLAVMLPYLFKQAAFNPLMGNCLLDPFSIERPLIIPQVASPLDSGIFSIFLIHTHATGGVSECVDFESMSSSEGSYGVGGDLRGFPLKCSCGVDVTIFTSKSQENPGRPFFRCKTKRDPKSWTNKRDGHVFKWVEDAVYEEVEDALPKFGIIANEINQAKSEVNELNVMLQELKDEAILSKREIRKWKVCLLMCFVWLCLISILIVYMMLSQAKKKELAVGY